MNLFDDITSFLKGERAKGVIVEEWSDAEEEMVTYRQFPDGRRDQLFPPPEAPPRRIYPSVELTTPTMVVLWALVGTVLWLLFVPRGEATIGSGLLWMILWPLLLLAKALGVILGLLGGFFSTKL